jgi:hypothetical protein
MMRRHELDPVSLTFGFAFTGLGLLFLVGQADQALRLRWVWPLLLAALGVGILLDVARGRDRTGPDPVPAALDPGPDPVPAALDPGLDPTPADLDPTPADLDRTPADPGSDPADPGPDPDAGQAVDDREHPS